MGASALGLRPAAQVLLSSPFPLVRLLVVKRLDATRKQLNEHRMFVPPLHVATDDQPFTLQQQFSQPGSHPPHSHLPPPREPRPQMAVPAISPLRAKCSLHRWLKYKV